MRLIILCGLCLLSSLAPAAACNGKPGNGKASFHEGPCPPGILLQCGDAVCDLVDGNSAPAVAVDGLLLQKLDTKAGLGRLLGRGFAPNPGNLFKLRTSPSPLVAGAVLSTAHVLELARALGVRVATQPAAPLGLKELAELLGDRAGSATQP